MSSDVAIRVEDLGKAYTIKHQQSDHVTLAQVALEKARHPLRRSTREEFWALRNVSFEVKQGEVLGVIGRNGAGKSTLLKLLTRITGPTTGRIDLWGRVGSLLEVGTGFHPELTGRENIYLNGSILGMSRKEIDRQFDAIVDFAGVERFLDTPVKRYSSGMYVRLAFAVAAHLETEILLIDEVLAVGDQDFQRRCLGKMHDVAADGRTVLFVSHQLESVSTLCDRVAWLEDGTSRAIGETSAMVSSYLSNLSPDAPKARRLCRVDDGWHIAEATASESTVRVGEPIRIRIRIADPRGLAEPSSVFPAIELTSVATGHLVVHCDGRRVGAQVDTREITTCSWDWELRSPWLVPGDYAVRLTLCTSGGVLDQMDPALVLTVLPEAISREVTSLEFNMANTVADFSLTSDPKATSKKP